MSLTAIAINCSLKSKTDEDSSTDKMIGLIASALAARGVEFGETIRIVEAMQSKDFKELNGIPEPVSQAVQMAASNAAHLAGLLQERSYPGLR